MRGKTACGSHEFSRCTPRAMLIGMRSPRSGYAARARKILLYRVDQRLGRNVRVEHAELLPEVQPLARDSDAVVVTARNEIFRAPLGEGAQDLEIRLYAQLLVGGRLDAEVGDDVALHVRLVVLRLPDRGDAVAQRGLGGQGHEVVIRALAQVAVGRDAVGAPVREKLGPLLQPAAVEALGVTEVELLHLEPQFGGEYGFFRDGHGPSCLSNIGNGGSGAVSHEYVDAIRISPSPTPWTYACNESPGFTGLTPAGVPVMMMSPG